MPSRTLIPPPSQSPFCLRRSLTGWTSLLPACREHTSETIDRASTQLGQSLRLLRPSTSLDSLRGVEGYAAQTYFNAVEGLILHQKEEFFFHGHPLHSTLSMRCFSSCTYF